ncbi:type II toxin-antitoxin system RelN family antitoxin [Brunnivagina elsteri]|uniref:Uncharacterized protein n=1 Tax=Brunnivagina elsteri CCALA 953 TaxID=987040 RepID=A0A2A2TKT0_9CYAN|nr:hypothetical protein [Calothrix elsteri]PAX57187.1 hypothetical protein CK510_09085 [Calothrix elsteri CCALA 953]
MRAQERMGTVDEKGQLSLDEPLKNKHSRVKVIILYFEDTDEDDESKESILNGFRTSLQELKVGKTRDISKLWDGIDDE